MEENNKAKPVLRDERRSFNPRDLNHLPRREATDLTPEELAEISVAEWRSEA